MSGVRPFERRQPARHINPGQAPKDRATLGLKEMPKFWEQAMESELAFAKAMLAERRNGGEKFTLGADPTPGTEQPRSIAPQSAGRVRSSADFL